MKIAEFFRAVDDSDLSVYEKAFVLRVWRRGQCWEKLESIANTTGMSIGKASQVRRDLLAKGWIVEAVADGRIVYEVAIPNCCNTSPSESEFHQVKPEFHQVKPEFHQVSALPFNRQKEDSPIKYMSAPGESAPVDDEQEAKQRAWEATADLIEFWEQLTKRKRPPLESADFRDKWMRPFNEIWIACGRSVDAAKAKIQAVRDGILAGGGRIFDPAKLPGHVQALVDAELLPMTARLNGNGHANYKNNPEAREAHNREVMAKVAADIESGAWSPWQI